MRPIVSWSAFAFAAALALSALAATGAAGVGHPLFLTLRGRVELLLLSGTGGLVLIRATDGGALASVGCERDAVHGWILNLSTLTRLVLFEFSGNCLFRTVIGASNCTEPIRTAFLQVELGLASSTEKTVLSLLAPESGTLVFDAACGANSVTISGAVVGEIPALNSHGEQQIDVERNAWEVLFNTVNKSEQQALTAIFLLGVQMSSIELSAAGSLGGKTSLETTKQSLLPAGPTVITTKE
jgi:hypothetical protein